MQICLEIDAPDVMTDRDTLAGEVKIAYALKVYSQGGASLSHAAEIANVPLQDFMRECVKSGIPTTLMGVDDLREELAALENDRR